MEGERVHFLSLSRCLLQTVSCSRWNFSMYLVPSRGTEVCSCECEREEGRDTTRTTLRFIIFVFIILLRHILGKFSHSLPQRSPYLIRTPHYPLVLFWKLSIHAWHRDVCFHTRGKGGAEIERRVCSHCYPFYKRPESGELSIAIEMCVSQFSYLGSLFVCVLPFISS